MENPFPGMNPYLKLPTSGGACNFRLPFIGSAPRLLIWSVSG
jgi:hypothetical protein